MIIIYNDTKTPYKFKIYKAFLLYPEMDYQTL
jgi:hypothetical protein